MTVNKNAEGIAWNGKYYTVLKSGYVPIMTVSVTMALQLFHDTPDYYKEV